MYKSASWTNVSGLAENGIMRTDRGDAEKIIAMLVLGFGSFLSGMLPVIVPTSNRRRFPLVTSLFLCFGAGILLATALIHILPEVREQLDSNLAEIALCTGFFVIYFIDEFIHFFLAESIQHAHQSAIQDSRATIVTNYGAVNTTPLVNDNGYQNDNQHQDVHGHSGPHTLVVSNDNRATDLNTRVLQRNHSEPCMQSMTGTSGLFVALSLHSAIEGLAIGVQSSATKVILLLGAVSCHKFVMSFCLGLELSSNQRTPMQSHFIGILVFSVGAVFGIIMGMIIVDLPEHFMATTLPVIQALAGGTLLYVTVCEVIPREKARSYRNSIRKSAGLMQFLAVAFGFSCMAVINMILVDNA